MSDPQSTPPGSANAPESATPPQPPRPSRLRRFFLRHLPLAVAGIVVLLVLTVTGAYFWASSAAFENYIRQQMVRQLEDATGGRVEIASFHWHLLRLEADAGGVVVHGLEAPGEAPYARIEQAHVQISLLGFWSPRILLHALDITQPQLHLIVYRNGSTNQPQPRVRRKPGKPMLDRFFDLKAGRIAVEQGTLHYENRAASFDFQDRFIPLNLTANDVSLRISYVPATLGKQESYRIEAGARNLNLTRGSPDKDRPVEGVFQATLELTRSRANLNSLRITTHRHGLKERTMEVTGFLDNFAHPRWQAKVTGELDMRLLNPLTGYPYAPDGLARLDLNGAGKTGIFRVDGNIHVEGGAYIGTGVVATGVGLDAHIHADPEQLLVTSIAARLRQGGQISGNLSLIPWLPTLPGAATLRPSTASSKARVAPVKTPQPSDDTTIPVNGRVEAYFKDVALDTLLEMVSRQPFQHLGLHTRINGPATALWVNGDVRTLSVKALLNLIAPAQVSQAKSGVPGDRSSSLGWGVPASGLIDATYTQRNGAVDLRKLELHTPASQLEAHGQLGAYPLTSPSALAVGFHSRNLSEFDMVLRDLGLNRNGKSGASALPIALFGQADFQGNWSGSLANPHIAGTARATQVAVEIPTFSDAHHAAKQSAPPQFVRLDSMEATGSYSAARIDLEHGLLHHGNTEITFSGSLTGSQAATAHGAAFLPAFNANAMLHLRLHAGQVDVNDLRSFTGRNLPVAGVLDAQLQVDGPLRALGGAGWIELDRGSVYGEPIGSLRLQGNIANQLITVTSGTISKADGSVSAAGNYSLQSHRFQLHARGAGIDVSHIEYLHRKNLAVTGKLGFTMSGTGTLHDPHLETQAALTGLTLSGEALGNLKLVGHTANRFATYDVLTQLHTAKLTAHGVTAFDNGYATQAKLDFSHFNVNALFRLAHLPGFSGESALAGTANIQGPLARPEELRGEARLGQLVFTVAGVHLQSQGGIHATLANALIRFDPLHITGEDTDLHAQGTLSLKDKHQLDLAANGTVNLKVIETMNPDLTAGGVSTIQVEAHGPLMNPGLRGRIDLRNGSLALGDMPNGLSQLHGTLEFNQNRLEVKSLTAMSGGGQLSVGGYLAYQNGVYADLTATGTGIRVRYPQGVSSLANGSFHLQGMRNNLRLSGNVLITRFTVSPDLSIAALVAQANAVQPIAPPNAPSNHIRLDIRITSSPQLNFQNAYAKLAGYVDLRLRGTLASPSLLGRVSFTEGSGIIAGTRYDLQRGDIYFTNPVRIEPSIDLNATARVSDYDITLYLHGTPRKLSVSYRSDPPLPEADVVALLALGRTGNQERLYTRQQENVSANPITDALLGGALNATVSSRVQKLFGAGSVKVDPNYVGTLGNSTSRIIVEEQLGRKLTLTYATNVSTTSQQLIQAEIAINRHVSLQVARDESGVFSVVIKATRRYR
jgi:translocation and assembly module TamB